MSKKFNAVAWANRYKTTASSVRVIANPGIDPTRIKRTHVKKGRLSEQGKTHIVVAEVMDAPDVSLVGTFEHIILRPYAALKHTLSSK